MIQQNAFQAMEVSDLGGSDMRICVTRVLSLCLLAPWLAGMPMPASAQQSIPEDLHPKADIAKPSGKKPQAKKTKTSMPIPDPVLMLNGSDGAIQLQRTKDGLQIIRLSLAGEMISQPGEACQVDIVSSTPMQLKSLGQPLGTQRYQAPVEACPFMFDVLEGSVLVPAINGTCELKEADCRVDPAGLWGPDGKSFTPRQINDYERARAKADKDMRTSFKLLTETLDDRSDIKSIAREQASFAAGRASVCDGYEGEAVHNFCSLRVTQARTMALKTFLVKEVASQKQAEDDEAQKEKEKAAQKAAREAATKSRKR